VFGGEVTKLGGT